MAVLLPLALAGFTAYQFSNVAVVEDPTEAPDRARYPLRAQYKTLAKGISLFEKEQVVGRERRRGMYGLMREDLVLESGTRIITYVDATGKNNAGKLAGDVHAAVAARRVLGGRV